MKKLLVILLFILLAPFGIKAQPTSRKYVNFHMQKLGGTFSYTSGQKPTRFISNGTMQKPVTAIPTAQFNFSSTISTVTGCTNVYGDPTASPSFTNTGTGWILHMVGSGWNYNIDCRYNAVYISNCCYNNIYSSVSNKYVSCFNRSQFKRSPIKWCHNGLYDWHHYKVYDNLRHLCPYINHSI